MTIAVDPISAAIIGAIEGEARSRDAIQDWRTWLRTIFGGYLTDDEGRSVGFAPHMEELWEWVWALRRGVRPRPFVAIWPRGGAKSTSAELACVAVAARRERSYALYICSTQQQADDHVGNVATMLESSTLEAYHPDLGKPAVGKYGNSKGWRRNRIRTPSFTVDALGLDSASRGVKLDEDRPGLIILDDLDEEQDSAEIVERKLARLTKGILPAGSADMAVLAIQNIVHTDSIFAMLAGVSEKTADFLNDRIISGPIPALRDMAYEERDGAWVIVAGSPTWAGQGVERCQQQIATIGITAFLSECQHAVEERTGGMYDHLSFRHCQWSDVPDLVRIVVWVDPAVTDRDSSDSQGIQADGVASDGTIYRLWSWEQRSSPDHVLKMAIRKAIELGAQHVGVETDQGGDLWRGAYRDAGQQVVAEMLMETGERVMVPPFTSDKAGAGHGSKVHRSSLMLRDYEKAKFVHVLGTHETLERALRRFPKLKPYDLVDACYWGWADLTGRQRASAQGLADANATLGEGARRYGALDRLPSGTWSSRAAGISSPSAITERPIRERRKEHLPASQRSQS